ncbi:hypothetical protein [Aquiflexum gelatinilyticum]|nr:hypothetical protein [Aquiflexum gelatinilyticum]MCS4433829.1 hypothetical protein [Aquiflexum gelatinilyticum]
MKDLRKKRPFASLRVTIKRFTSLVVQRRVPLKVYEILQSYLLQDDG